MLWGLYSENIWLRHWKKKLRFKISEKMAAILSTTQSKKMARNFQQLQHPPFRIAIEIEFSTENPNKINSNQKVPSS